MNTKRTKEAQNALSEKEVFEITVRVFKTLGDPTRTKILYGLQKKELSVRDIALVAGISESATSHQLALLKEQKLVAARREGTTMYYFISYQHIHNLLQEAEYYADHIINGHPDHPRK